MLEPAIYQPPQQTPPHPPQDKLMLEPAGRQRDVVYVALVPDTELSLTCSRGFFKELSCVYELLRFGTHRPINFEIRDSIIRIGNKDKVRSDENIDDWFKNIGQCTQLQLVHEYKSQYDRVCMFVFTANIPRKYYSICQIVLF